DIDGMKLVEERLELVARAIGHEHDLAIGALTELAADAGEPLERQTNETLALPVSRRRGRRQEVAHADVDADAQSRADGPVDLLEATARVVVAQQQLLDPRTRPLDGPVPTPHA